MRSAIEPVSAAESRYISGGGSTVVIAGDASRFIDKLRAPRGDVEVIKVSDLDPGNAKLRSR